MSKAGTFYPVPIRNLIESSLLLISLVCAAAVAEEPPDDSTSSWYLQAGGYVHFSDDEEYEGPPWFGGIEHRDENLTLAGFSVFNNSFGDLSEYLYLGKEFHPWQKHPAVRLKITVGIVHGYEDEHHDILPIRWGDSWGIGAVPTIGYQKNRVGFDLAILSASGLLFLVGYQF